MVFLLCFSDVKIQLHHNKHKGIMQIKSVPTQRPEEHRDNVPHLHFASRSSSFLVGRLPQSLTRGRYLPVQSGSTMEVVRPGA